MAAVSGVDHGNRRLHRGHQRGAFLRVTHRNNIRKTADRAGGVGNTLTLCRRRTLGLMETNDLATQFIHSRLKTQASSSGWFVEQRCQLFIAAFLPVIFRILDDVLRLRNEFVDLLHRKVCNVDQISFHKLTPFVLQRGLLATGNTITSGSNSHPRDFPGI